MHAVMRLIMVCSFRIMVCAFSPNVVEKVSLHTGSEMNGFLLVPSAPFVSHQCSTSVPGGSVAPGGHLDDLAEPCASLPDEE